jgi:hypothetical protein
MLYVYTVDGWVPAIPLTGASPRMSIKMAFGKNRFTIQAVGGTPREFENPSTQKSARLYLGDGYEVDYVESNRGAEFLVHLESFKTRVLSESGTPAPTGNP